MTDGVAQPQNGVVQVVGNPKDERKRPQEPSRNISDRYGPRRSWEREKTKDPLVPEDIVIKLPRGMQNDPRWTTLQPRNNFCTSFGSIWYQMTTT